MRKTDNWPRERNDRHATALLADVPGCRVVAFTLAPDQAVPVHTSASRVIVNVVEGSGIFSGAETSLELYAGDSALYAENEAHGMIAGPDGLRFLAVITPNPSAQPTPRNG